MRKVLNVVIGVIVGAATLGCGGGSSGGNNGGGAGGGPGASCSLSAASGGTTSVLDCEEVANPTSSEITQLMSACSSSILDAGSIVGTFANTLCTRQMAVGGCRESTSTVTIVLWFYAPFTADLARSTCSSAGGTFVSP
jgi:hypothetical protein